MSKLTLKELEKILQRRRLRCEKLLIHAVEIKGFLLENKYFDKFLKTLSPVIKVQLESYRVAFWKGYPIVSVPDKPIKASEE
jgi:hypothetical protein